MGFGVRAWCDIDQTVSIIRHRYLCLHSREHGICSLPAMMQGSPTACCDGFNVRSLAANIVQKDSSEI